MNEKIIDMTSKISELQGLRGLAIIGVLVYHVWPDYFVNGYLGVDVFFVLSGYFMALITLANPSELGFLPTASKFYYRRIYRVLPLYLLNLFTTALLAPLILVTFDKPSFFKELRAALTLITNFSMLFQNQNYFDFHTSIQWFKHYWSLCVEMQFYLIVPGLFFVARKFPTSINLFAFWPGICCLSVASMIFALKAFPESGPLFVFSMLPPRIWQFAAGIIAWYVQGFADELLEAHKECELLKRLDKSYRHWSAINALTITVLGILIYPVMLNTGIFQGIITVVAAGLIVACQNDSKLVCSYRLLGWNPLVIIGDASYAIYITHWGIVTLIDAKLDASQQNKLLLLMFCFAYGFLVHFLIEKPLYEAKLQPKHFFTYLMLFYVCFFGYLPTMKAGIEVSQSTKNLFNSIVADPTIWPAIASQINPAISVEMAIHADNFKCRYFPKSQYSQTMGGDKEEGIVGAEIGGNGTLKVLVVGNSHAACIMPAVKFVIEGSYAELNLMVFGGTTPFEGFYYDTRWEKVKETVVHYEPDVIFFVFKHQNDMEVPVTEPIEKDFHTVKMQEMVDFLSNRSKVVLITGPHFEAEEGFTSLKFAERIYPLGGTSDYGFKQEKLESSHPYSSQRWRVINKRCENCIYMNITQAYCKNGWCSPLDAAKTVPLTDDNNHLTIFGAYALIPYLREYWIQAEAHLEF